MASAKQKKATFISHKLTFLKDQGDELISAVGQYVNRITVAGDSWTQGGDNNVEFQELCQKIESASMFLCEKCQELADLTSQSAATASTPSTSNRQPVAPLASTATTSYRQPAAQLASTASTSYRQPAAPLAFTATKSYRQSTESVQAADDTQLKPVFAKIAVIEEAMCSFRSRTERVAEQQSGIDQQLKELLSKLSESDKKHSSRFKQVKQQISDISETQDAIEEQMTRLQSMEKQLQTISTAQKRQKEKMESRGELLEKLVHVPNLLESVKENVDTLQDRIDEIIGDSSNKYKDLETEMRDQSDKVMANTQSVQLIYEGQAQNSTLLRELETRLQTLEADGGRNVKDVQKQAEKGEANFRILCQMLNDRLRPLEQLRTSLNERASMRDDNVTKLSQVIQEVAVMSPRLQQLDQEQKTRLQSLEKQLQKISTTQNRQKTDMESQAELVEKLVHAPNLLQSVKENVDALDDKIDAINVDCRSKHEDIVTLTRDLADKVMANTQNVQLISKDQAKNTTLLRKSEKRLQTLQADHGRNVKDVQKQAEKGEANLSQVIQEVAVMSPRIQQLEFMTSQPRIGFSARTWAKKGYTHQNLTNYTDVLCNVGNHFNAYNGQFTAPSDGLYSASISLWTLQNSGGAVGIKHRKKASSQCISTATSVVEIMIGDSKTGTCTVGIVDMQFGDVLFAYSTYEFNEMVTFTCFKL